MNHVFYFLHLMLLHLGAWLTLEGLTPAPQSWPIPRDSKQCPCVGSFHMQAN